MTRHRRARDEGQMLIGGVLLAVGTGLLVLRYTTSALRQYVGLPWIVAIAGLITFLVGLVARLRTTRRGAAAVSKVGTAIGGVLIGGLAIGAAFLGWWLYDGSSRGDFECAVNLVPCEVLGGLLMALPAFALLAGAVMGGRRLTSWLRRRRWGRPR